MKCIWCSQREISNNAGIVGDGIAADVLCNECYDKPETSG